ncbi:NERD domain-containing protein [Nocardioides limicola]|uniref:NERD domain-containing protein n=1 Tax=Nocardioides limicola TaxID=2803368 RepID=UPI00193B2FCD|nr:NERD domain-containing protein [Nocardioides sp. DJM-14]
MSRVRPYPRRELRGRFTRWLGRNTLVLIAVVLLFAIVAGLGTWALWSVYDPGPTQWYLMGVLHAFSVFVVVAMVATLFIVTDGEAMRHLRGAWGEENTSTELRRAKRKKLIWGWVDSIPLQQGDIDHLVVTRAGGVLAIDSKWRSTTNQTDRASMVEAAQRARGRAVAVVHTLLKRERGGHRERGAAYQVRAVVVLWGAEAQRLGEPRNFEGVDFVPGRSLVPWLSALDGDRVDAAAAKDVLGQIEAFRAGVAERAT